MGQLSRGQTYGATETITNTKLHNLVDLGGVSNIVNADISSSAAIAYSKLSLTGSIVNADINSSAAIAYSKLNLVGSVSNADLAGSIADSKLNQITTDSKVHGSSITGLASLSSGAGIVPVENLGSGTANDTTVLYGDQTYKSPPTASNVLFARRCEEVANSGTNEGDTSFIVGSTPSLTFYRSYSSYNGSNVNMVSHRWTKTINVNTLTLHCRGRNVSSSAGVIVTLSAGGASNTGIIASSSFTAITPFTVDVSGLSNGTVYDVTIGMKSNHSASPGSVEQMQLSSYSIEASG